jgi:hypothetical protein
MIDSFKTLISKGFQAKRLTPEMAFSRLVEWVNFAAQK